MLPVADDDITLGIREAEREAIGTRLLELAFGVELRPDQRVGDGLLERSLAVRLLAYAFTAASMALSAGD